MAEFQDEHTDIVVSAASEAQAQLVPGANVRYYEHLTEVAHVFGAEIEPKPNPRGANVSKPSTVSQDQPLDLADIQGQHEARWALEITAAGGHHLLLQGPPGAGKTKIGRAHV